MSTVTVLSGPERRRRWTAAEKLRIVEESLAGEASVAEVSRRHDVHPNLLHLWRRQARTGVLSVAPDDGSRFVPVAVATGESVTAVTASGAGVGLVIEVVLRNGRVLRVPEGVAPARAVVLADALEAYGR
jgi:transposase